MFARVAIYDIPVGRRADAEAAFQQAVARIRETPGLTEAVILLGWEADRAMTITYWESLRAMEASRVVASGLRSEAATAAGGEVVSVEEFEVMS